ncbi:MAG: N-acetyl-alpha-D-glucosaminyl L-malate synthase BshA [Vicinamibacterales bacterium]
MKIGIVCYATVGGSGVVATELAHALASRGHDIHLISADLPFRWRWGAHGLSFERVEAPTYPIFREPQYLLALTNTLVRVSRRHGLDLIHAHYAVPHATAAYLAHRILSAETGRPPKTVTTLHGTDITLVGSDPSYASVVGFSIESSHGVTAVSESLKRDTIASLGVKRDIEVIPNFLDCQEYDRRPDAELRSRLCPTGDCEAIVTHVSNFRAVKRTEIVLEIFRCIREQVNARLLMVGDGPQRPAVERQAAETGLGDVVHFVGEQHDVVSWLSVADLFLLPSGQESFGLAALEAMSCQVPVIASRVGGLPEVITHGVTGFTFDPQDVAGMAACGVALLKDPARRQAVGDAAARDVRRRFCETVVVPRYERYYEDVVAGRTDVHSSGA